MICYNWTEISLLIVTIFALAGVMFYLGKNKRDKKMTILRKHTLPITFFLGGGLSGIGQLTHGFLGWLCGVFIAVAVALIYDGGGK